MKILLVNDYASPRGGAEISQLVLRDALRRRGHDVRTFAARPRELNGGESTADYECFGTTSRFRTLLQVFNPWAAAKLRAVLADFRPDVVQVRLFLTQLSPLILPLLRNVASVHHVTWYRPVCPLGTKVLPDGSPCRDPVGRACLRNGCLPARDWAPLMIQMQLWRRWAGAFRATVANSSEGRRLIEAEGLGQAHVVWNGVPVVPARPPLPITPLVVFAGRLTRQKGADILVRAFSRVTKRLPEARLLIAGDGPERPLLAALVNDLGLSQQVSIAGWLDRASLDQRCRQSWLQAVPSRWAESFANVAAEAMMRGTAVVGAAVGAMAEYVRDGESGILVPGGDENALAEALLTILGNRELAERMGQRGREIALAELSDDACADRFLSLHEALCASGPGPPLNRAASSPSRSQPALPPAWPGTPDTSASDSPHHAVPPKMLPPDAAE